jgi:hypothetical protein
MVVAAACIVAIVTIAEITELAALEKARWP